MAQTKFDIIKNVVEQHQAQKISMLLGTTRKRILLDVQTANVLYKIFQQVKPENFLKLNNLPWDRLVSFAWSKVG